MAAPSLTPTSALHVVSRFLREGIVTGLRAGGRVDLVGATGSVAALAELVRRHAPRVVVVEVDESFGTANQLRSLLAREHGHVLVGLTAEPVSLIRPQALDAGFAELCQLHDGIDMITDAIVSASFGRAALHQRVPSDHTNGTGPLTCRQMQVLQLTAAGFRSTDIAARLGVSPKAVDRHRANAVQALHAASLAEAVAVAVDARLIGIPR